MRARGGVALPALYTALIFMAVLGAYRCASAYGQYQLSRRAYEASLVYYSLDEKAERFRLEVNDLLSEIPFPEETDSVPEILYALTADYPSARVDDSPDSAIYCAAISVIFEADECQLYIQLGIQTDGAVTVMTQKLL